MIYLGLRVLGVYAAFEMAANYISLDKFPGALYSLTMRLVAPTDSTFHVSYTWEADLISTITYCLIMGIHNMYSSSDRDARELAGLTNRKQDSYYSLMACYSSGSYIQIFKPDILPKNEWPSLVRDAQS
jgi:hypothetical protein